MTFSESIRTCLREKYATFSGRAPRSEYWWFQLFYLLIVLGLVLLMALTGGLSGAFDQNGELAPGAAASLGIFGIIFLIVMLGMILPLISVTVRRFHDYNLSGWWYLGGIIAGLIPFVGFLASIAILVITILKGTDGPNNFGPDPLGSSDADVFN
ncbi:Uncharacterized membrane protein YhaH, DUF805 family [Cognatiyoonia koreensis]|uniref:Uncharacterized membrane protein YhaH, DUF805 family n=1 Tax=Cognatiyoonia koreensis TaxID=364200 RepID=A0A1I0ML83_9RHOB|nr:DUF805 domain-containing protein [Cognatiyoonia koreensis]SEV88647.1 Uncharacterized membrane protein YhaH, DUF805 family [Cognatiyoonia koreensis]